MRVSLVSQLKSMLFGPLEAGGEEEVLAMLEEGLDLVVDQDLDLEVDLDLEGDLVLEGLVVDLNPVQEVVFKEEVVKVVAEQGWILIDHQGKVLVVGS